MAQVTCVVEGCTKPSVKKLMCGPHYGKVRKYSDPLYMARPIVKDCRIDRCVRPPRSATAGICEVHYYRIRRNGTVQPKVTTRDLPMSPACEYCGQPNDPVRVVARIYCSYRCETRARRRAPLLPPLCQVCAIRMPAGSRADRQWCDACYQDRRDADSRDRKHRRRIVVNGLDGEAYERIDDREIFERDGWRCGLCRKKVDRRLRSPHPMSASIDHVVPIAEGGRHVRANVQLAHRWCNGSKGSRGGGEQLALL